MTDRLMWVANGLLLLLLIWLAAQQLAKPQSALQVVDTAPLLALLEPPAATAEQNLRIITQAGLFGVEGDDTIISAPAEILAPTPLKLILHGVFLAENPRDGHAIISTEKGSHRSYIVGDALPGNAKLNQILVDRVILERSGNREFLQLRARAGGGNDR